MSQLSLVPADSERERENESERGKERLGKIRGFRARESEQERILSHSTVDRSAGHCLADIN